MNKIIMSANESPYNAMTLVSALDQLGFQDMDFNRYPDPEATELRKALSSYIGCTPENIICTNGSDELIKMIYEGLVAIGDTVGYLWPTFSEYQFFGDIRGCQTIRLNLDDQMNVTAEAIIDFIRMEQCKMFILCNPNNPTGKLLSRSCIQKILTSTSAIIVVDEAYCEFAGLSVADLIDQYDNLLVLRTLSKAFGLASIRLGYGLAGSTLIEQLNKIKPLFNVNTLSQKIGEFAINNSEQFLQYVPVIIKERAILYDQLTEMSGLEPYESYANFILIKCDDKSKVLDLLNRYNIKTRNFKDDTKLKDYIRISVGTPSENQYLIDVLKEGLYE